jgi:hypothetical protein
MPRLAGLVSEVVGHDAERRPRLLVGLMAPVAARSDEVEETPEDLRHASAFIGAAR